MHTKGCLRWRPNLNSLSYHCMSINLLLEKQNWMTHFLHFTVPYLVAWPLSETGVDLVLIETSLHFT